MSEAERVSSGQILNVVVAGPGGVGKSAITVQYCSGHFVEEYDPTIEDNFRKQCSVDGVESVLEILDTAGQEEYKSMRDQWMRPAQGFVLVYSIIAEKSFQEIAEFRDQILRVKDTDRWPIVLCGNKCDLQEDREVEKAKGAAQAKEWEVPFFETSAKTTENVSEAFSELVRQIRKNPAGSTSRPTKKSGGKRCLLF